jgi:hypothetical protein
VDLSKSVFQNSTKNVAKNMFDRIEERRPIPIPTGYEFSDTPMWIHFTKAQLVLKPKRQVRGSHQRIQLVYHLRDIYVSRRERWCETLESCSVSEGGALMLLLLLMRRRLLLSPPFRALRQLLRWEARHGSCWLTSPLCENRGTTAAAPPQRHRNHRNRGRRES